VVRILALAAFAGIALAPGIARATLEEDAAVLDALVTASGGHPTVSRTIFLEEGHASVVPLKTERRCIGFAAVAARSVRLAAMVGTPADSDDEVLAALAPSVPGTKQLARRRESESGLFTFSACGPDAAAVDRVAIRMLSARGAVQLRVFESDEPLSDPATALGRSPGPEVPRGDPGPSLSVAPISERKQRAEASARADGARSFLTSDTKADASGAGAVTVRAGLGCHRFAVMAEQTENQTTMDVDAELCEKDTGAIVARDFGETPDARLEACFGEPTEVQIGFVGAPPSARVVIADALTPLPEGIPAHWGEKPRAAMGRALGKRLRTGPTAGPVFETLGGQGTTSTGIVVEPGRCYAASVAILRGTSLGMRLVARASSRASTDEVSRASEAGAVVFCADGARRARIQVDAPGPGVGWVLAVWLLGRRAG